MMLQLNPAIPVIVTSKDNAKGMAVGWVDYSQEHNLIWIVAIDETGEVWCTPNTEIRMQKNWTMNRRISK
jgi:hypothetical protein